MIPFEALPARAGYFAGLFLTGPFDRLRPRINAVL